MIYEILLKYSVHCELQGHGAEEFYRNNKMMPNVDKGLDEMGQVVPDGINEKSKEMVQKKE